MGLLVIVGAVLSPAFLSKGNISNILAQIAVLGLGALGMTYVMIGGFFDLSIAGILALNGVLVVGLQEYLGPVGSILGVLVIGALIGVINGTILRIIKGNFGASIMVTFGTGIIYSSLALLYTGGYSLTLQVNGFYHWIVQGRVLGLPAAIVIMIVCALILHVVLRHSRFGRRVYLTGANAESARLSGIPVHRVRTVTFIISGVIVTIGSLIQTAQTVSASPTSGGNYVLDVIAAVAIGGTSFTGGEGNIPRTVIGVLLIGVLDNVLILAGFDTSVQMMAQGFIIAVALILDSRKKSKYAGAR